VQVPKLLLPAALVVALVCPATAQVAILQIQMVEGEGAVYGPSARSTRPLTIEVTDETGKPVEGAAVSFHLPEEGAGGSFPNGLRTAVATTDAHGLASVHGLQANRIAGRFQVRIVASKAQARAGIVSFQYVGESAGGPAPAAPHTAPRPAAKASWLSTKWIVIAAAVGGAAAAGLVAARSGGSTPAPPAAPLPTPTMSIGIPTIVVGHP
jgi:hypothetical protein